jgi:hypothetical protein
MTITTLSGPEGSGGLAERGHDRALCPVVAERIRRELHEAEMRKADEDHDVEWSRRIRRTCGAES